MQENGLSKDLELLIERVASYPHGLGFLHLAEIETIAVLLGVSAITVTDARARIETPDGRKLLIRKVREAKERMRAAGKPPSPWWMTQKQRRIKDPPPPKTPEQLIEEIRAHELGIAFLTKAPIETLAVTFEVHPEIVLKARAIIEGNVERSVDDANTL